jgi:alpha-tubulin suppressor-like RCC1 family protein
MDSGTSFSSGVCLKNGWKAAAAAFCFGLAVMAVSTGAMAQAGGTPWAWGNNALGQAGNGTYNNALAPVPVTSPNAFTAIAGGHTHSVALKADGTVWTWGDNSWAQLGTGSGGNGWPGSSNVPVQVTGATGLSSVIAVASGFKHSLALTSAGTVWGWGYNFEGALGNGTGNNDINAPVQTAFSGGTIITAIAGGGDHSLAVRDDGTVWAWGYNVYGALGDGSAVQVRTTPVQVYGLTGITAVAGGNYHSLALKGDGTVWAWGNNGEGELGNGAGGGSNVPVQVLNLTGVKAIAAGWYHCLALKYDGTVWAWGWNAYGQLGQDAGNSNTPVQVAPLSGITAIAAGYGHSLALKDDGTVWAWGYNYEGELGNGTTASGSHSSPAQVLILNDVTAIASGAQHNLATVSLRPPETANGGSPASAQTWSDKNTQTWPAVSGADSYKMYRGTKPDLPNLLTTGADSCTRYQGSSTSAVTADDPSSLPPGDFYWYLVVGVNAYGEGSPGLARLGSLSAVRIVNSSGACP